LSLTTLLAGAVLVLGPFVAHAQPAGKVHRIGVVTVLQPSPEPPTVRAFRQTLRELGYVEGRNIVVETRYAAGNVDRLPELLDELIRLKSDVLVTGSVAGALAAKKATSTVPVVFAGVLDASAQGVVTNLARPGGNLTGATYGVGGADIAGKWVELLKEIAPRMSHVAVLLSSGDPQSPDQLRAIHAAAKRLKAKVSEFDATNDAMLQRAFAGIRASGAQGIVVTNSPYFGANRFKLVGFAAEQRLPAIYFFNLFPDVGGLMSYGGSIEESYRRAALYVDKILKGAKPGDLPIDQASKFELVINLKTAKALGLALPGPLLLRADRVIQ
jgi:putative tryptophan/tyrosine transport system substrate-binding protein